MPEKLSSRKSCCVSASQGMSSVYFNKGENCIAAGRLFVEESVHDEFISRVVSDAWDWCRRTQMTQPWLHFSCNQWFPVEWILFWMPWLGLFHWVLPYKIKYVRKYSTQPFCCGNQSTANFRIELQRCYMCGPLHSKLLPYSYQTYYLTSHNAIGYCQFEQKQTLTSPPFQN